MPYKDREKQKEAQRIWARKNRPKTRNRIKARNAKIVGEAKSVPCMDCGASYPHYVMDLDHREDEEKLGCVGTMCHAGVSIVRLKEEIAKCDVVCANCHRERTWSRYQKNGVLPLP